MLWLYVASGGAIGASCRYALSILLPTNIGSFPWATWSANILGCFLMGIFAAASEKYPVLQVEWRLFLAVGILGGFTTFSSFGLETLQMFRHQLYILSFCYIGSSLILGLLAVFLGYSVLKALIL